jgi:hypothetical protein
VKTNQLILPAAALLVSATLVGGWFIHLERACDGRAMMASGDVQVRRGPGGQCYLCRDQGWLSDISYPRCAASDRPYEAG